MSVYVDGCVLPVPKDKLAAYRAMARKFGGTWIVFKSRRHRDA